MNELAKHIEKLLLDNDCVIVPDLGGFIAYYQPAQYVEDEALFLSPYRSVGFNPQLIMNDGLLVQSYMQTHHTDYPDASREIAYEVNELKEKLYQDGMVDLPGIGCLYYTIRDAYDFKPNLNGILSPSMYALDSFLIKPLEPEQVDDCEPTILVERKNIKEFNYRWLNNAVAVAVAVILFFFLSVPVENTYIDKGNYASLGTESLFEAIRSQSMATSLSLSDDKKLQKNKMDISPVTVKVEKVTQISKAEPEPTPVKQENKEIEIKPKTNKAVSISQSVSRVSPKSYHIIVASLATSSDAERILQEYRRNGHTDAVVLEGNGRFRISLFAFESKDSASKKLNELKKADVFKDAWVLTSPK